MNLRVIFLSVIAMWSTIFLLQSHAFAASIFFAGRPEVLTDVNQINDDFFGGSDSRIAPDIVDSTNLTFTVNRLRQNLVRQIFGVGQSSSGVTNQVLGNVTLNINNTSAESIFGGGLNAGGNIIIGGSVNIKLSNVETENIFGGSTRIGGAGLSIINGSVNMMLNNVLVVGRGRIEGSGENPGSTSRQLAVQRDVNISMVNSHTHQLSLASMGSNTSNVGGNATLNAYNSRINQLFGAGDSQIFGDLTMTLDNCTANSIRPSNGGHVHGTTTINVNNSDVRLILPPLTRLPLPVHLLVINVLNNHSEVIQAGSEQGTVENVKLTIKESEITDVRLGAIGGTTKNASAVISSSNIFSIVLGSTQNGITDSVEATIYNSTFGERIGFLVGSDDNGFTNKATLNVNNSIIPRLLVGSGSQGVTNEAIATINNCMVSRMLVGSANQGVTNNATVNLNNSMASDIIVGATNNGRTTEATLNIFGNSMISNVFVGTDRTGHVDITTVNMHNGMVQQLVLGTADRGTILLSTANISDGTIGKLIVGSNEGNTQVATANISGGWIDTVDVQEAGYKTINFSAGKRSNINNSFQGLPPDLVNIQKDARTQWGSPSKDFPLTTNDLIWSGTILTPQVEEVRLTINNLFVADGGSFAPRELTLQKIAPVLHLEGSPQSMLIINKQLNINLSLSPKLIGIELYPIATVSSSFASPELFVKETRTGLIWSDLLFDPSTNIWFLTNVRASRDFYAFSTARESSNWLRQQHIYGLQSRANKVLKNGKDGLWLDLQGGFEKLATSFGKDSKMPWAMASMGYDFLQQIPSIKLKALYGFAFGVNAGKSKWKYYHTAKNDIQTGMVAGYLGLIHNSGIYATATVQLASNKIHTRTKGFNRSFKWTESTPTEAFELGWQYLFANGFSLNPRGQVILEQSSSHRFRLPYKNDHAILNKSFLTTTAFGLAGTYELQQLPLNIEASVDWFKGLSGDFAVKSRVLKMKFKHDNNTSLVRTALGLNTQLGEHFTLYGNVFMDLGNDKGIGGQIRANYKF